MQDTPANFAKRMLVSMNSHFRQKQAYLNYTVNPQNHKLDAKLGIAKNFMRLTNKALIGMNRYYFSRGAIFAGGLGLLCGYLCAEVDTNIQIILKNYQQTIKQGLIQSVLKNPSIKKQLNEALLNNVYTNPDIQYKLHQVLANKVIIPQKNNLFELSNEQLIKVFESEEFIKSLSGLAAKVITQNGDSIAKLALQFLDSDTMKHIMNDNVVKLLQSEDLNQQVAEQVKKLFISQLMHDKNKEVLYDWIRQKFIS